MAKRTWAGVDVGGKRKGFHLAVIDGSRVTELEHYPDAQTLANHLIKLKPQAIGIDSPQEWAPSGQKSRPAEREFAAKKICGIRYTPSLTTAQAHPGTYYEWIANGMELWNRLRDSSSLKVVEVFPTASWSIWHGPRGKRTRPAWSQKALENLPISLPATRWNQDFRDAVASALTAKTASTTASGNIALPKQSSS